MACSHTFEQKRKACYEFCPICLDDVLRMEQLSYSLERRKLHTALRKHCIYTAMDGISGCDNCEAQWKTGGPETHVQGCLCNPLENPQHHQEEKHTESSANDADNHDPK